jgi:hypothetical protein
MIGALLLAIQSVGAEPAAGGAKPATASSAASSAESQQFARERLMAMASHLGGLKTFSATMRATYDVVQASGQKIEFGEVRTLAIKRPELARVEQLASDGKRDLLLFDGKNITVYDARDQVFAQAPQPKGLDDAIDYLLKSLQLRLPLAPMLMSNFAQELQRSVLEVDFVESTDFLGPPTDHIAARTKNVDFQVWIADGDQPWPLRIVISYRLLDGSPQFSADLSEWNAAPDFAGTEFVFDGAKNATRIPFAVQFSTQPGQPQPDESNTTGDRP